MIEDLGAVDPQEEADDGSFTDSSAISQSLRRALDRDPVQDAEDSDLANVTGFPKDRIAGVRDQARKAKKLKEANIQGLLEDAPITANLLRNPHFAVPAQDDLNLLSGLEQALNKVKRFIDSREETSERIRQEELRQKAKKERERGFDGSFDPDNDWTKKENPSYDAWKTPPVTYTEQQKALISADSKKDSNLLDLGDPNRSLTEEVRDQFRIGRSQDDVARKAWTDMTVGLEVPALHRMEEDWAALKGLTYDSEDISIPGAAAEVIGQMWVPAVESLEVGLVTGSIASLAGGPVGFGTGFAGGAITTVFGNSLVVESGLAWLELKDLGVEKDIARPIALTVGGVNAGLEVAGVKFLSKPFQKLFRKHLTKGIYEQLGKTGIAKTFAKGYAGGIAGEVTTEVLQEVTQIIGEELAKGLDPKEFETLTAEQAAERIIEIMFKTGKAMILLGGIGPTVNLASDVSRYNNSKQTEEALKNIQAGSTKLQTPDRSPTALDRWAKAVVEDKGAVDTIYLDASEWTAHFQSKNIDPVEAAEELGVSDQLEAATESGGKILIPMGDYISKIARSEHHAGLAKHMTFSPSDMSAVEAEAWQKSFADEGSFRAEWEAETKIVQDEVIRTQKGDAIFQDIYQQLIDAEGAPKQAAQQAAVWSGFSRVLLSNNIDPVKFLEKYGLKVKQTTFKDFKKQMEERSALSEVTDEDGIVYQAGTGQIQTNSSNFEKWFQQSKAVDPADGTKPIRLYHATTHDIEEMDVSKMSMSNDWGKSIHTSNTTSDADLNYSGLGADLAGRVDHRGNLILDDMLSLGPQVFMQKYGLSQTWLDNIIRDANDPSMFPDPQIGLTTLMDKAAKIIAKDQLYGGHENIMPLYMSLQNPIQRGGPDETQFGAAEIDKFFRLLNGVVKKLEQTGLEEAGFDPRIKVDWPSYKSGVKNIKDGAKKSGKAKGGLLPIGLLIDNVRGLLGNTVAHAEAETPEGEIVRRVFEAMGFDGVIDRSVSVRFASMPGVTPDTTHYIAFKPNQVKSVFNRGTWSLTDNRVMFQGQTSNLPWKLKNSGDGDFYIQRVGDNAGRASKERQGPSDIAVTTDKEFLNPDYLFYVFQHLQPKMKARLHGTAQQSINQQDMNRVLIEFFNQRLAPKQDAHYQGADEVSVPTRSIAQRNNLGLYSAVEQAVLDMDIPAWKKGEGANAVDILTRLKKLITGKKKPQGVKADEIKWLGLEEFLLEGATGAKGRKVTQSEVLDFIRLNGLTIEEVVADRSADDSQQSIDWSSPEVMDDPEYVDSIFEDIMDEFDDFAFEDINLSYTEFGIDNIANWFQSKSDQGIEIIDELEQYAKYIEWEAQREAGLLNQREVIEKVVVHFYDKIRPKIREHFEDIARREAESRYLDNPYYEMSGSIPNENISIDIRGNDDVGWTGSASWGSGSRDFGVRGGFFEINGVQEEVREWAESSGYLPDPAEDTLIAKWGTHITGGESENYREFKFNYPDLPEEWEYDSHFPDKNTIAFARVTDRKSAKVDPGDIDPTNAPDNFALGQLSLRVRTPFWDAVLRSPAAEALNNLPLRVQVGTVYEHGPDADGFRVRIPLPQTMRLGSYDLGTLRRHLAFDFEGWSKRVDLIGTVSPGGLTEADLALTTDRILASEYPTLSPALISLLENEHWRELAEDIVERLETEWRSMATRRNVDNTPVMMDELEKDPLAGYSDQEVWAQGHSEATVQTLFIEELQSDIHGMLAGGLKHGYKRSVRETQKLEAQYERARVERLEKLDAWFSDLDQVSQSKIWEVISPYFRFHGASSARPNVMNYRSPPDLGGDGAEMAPVFGIPEEPLLLITPHTDLKRDRQPAETIPAVIRKAMERTVVAENSLAPKSPFLNQLGTRRNMLELDVDSTKIEAILERLQHPVIKSSLSTDEWSTLISAYGDILDYMTEKRQELADKHGVHIDSIGPLEVVIFPAEASKMVARAFTLEIVQVITNDIEGLRLPDSGDLSGTTFKIPPPRLSWMLPGLRLKEDFEAALNQSTEDVQGFVAAVRAHARLDQELRSDMGGVPDSPFKGDAWINLVMKRMIVEAVDRGYGSLAWPDSDVLVDRWHEMYREGYELLYDKKMVNTVDKLLGTRPVHEGAGLDNTSAGYWSVDLTPEIRSTVKENSFSFFQEEGDAPKGAFVPGGPGGENIIHLFEGADLSTFLHESGHVFLNLLGDLAETPGVGGNIGADYASALRFLGVESRTAIGREHHEKFARAFETYLREGKAPSLELQGAFQRFKQWLMQIYRDVKRQLGVEINDEIRGVFDRLLATEDEIKQMEAYNRLAPLFKDAAQASMTLQEFSDYMRRSELATQASMDELDRDRFDQADKELGKWIRAEHARVKKSVTEEVNQRKVYQALTQLRKKGGPETKLNKQAIEDAGIDPKTLPSSIYRVKEGQTDIDQVAGVFGYPSGIEMLTEMSQAEDKKALISRLTDERMEEEFGRTKDDAVNAIHNEKRGEFLALELNALNRRLNVKGTPAAIAKQVARDLINDRKVGHLRLVQFQTAEAKAARAAEKAMLAGNLEEAAAKKRQQLINYYLYREAQAALEEVKTGVNYLKKFNRTGPRKNLARDYLTQIDNALEMMDFRESTKASRENRIAFSKWVAARKADGEEVITSREQELRLDEAKKTHYKDLSMSELRGLLDVVKNIEKLGRLKQKLLVGADKRNLAVIIDEMVEIALNSNPSKKKDENFTHSKTKKVLERWREFNAAHKKLEFIFRQLDGENREIKDKDGNVIGVRVNGPWWTNMFKPLADAEIQEMEMQEEAVNKLNALFDEHLGEPSSRRKEMSRKRITPIGTHDKESILSMALNWGNAYNRSALLEGYGWTSTQAEQVFDEHLNAEDWAFVQGVWNFINEFWQPISELQYELTGVRPVKVEATPFTNQHGEFGGGYYPLKADPSKTERAHQLDEKQNVQDSLEVSFLAPMTKKGHTIERTGFGQNKVLLSLSVLSGHVTNVIHDYTHRKAIIQVNRLAKNPKVEEAITSTLGREAFRQINPWLMAIANDNRQVATVYDPILGHLRKGSTVVAMGLKVTTGIVQPLGFLQTMELLGNKWSMVGLFEFLKPGRFREKIAMVLEKSTVMRNRQRTFDRDVRDILKGLQGKESFADRMMPIYFRHIGFMDMTVSVPSWMGGYLKGLDEGMSEKDAIAYADSIVRQGQGSGGVKDLAQIQRGDEGKRLFSMFYSYFSVLFNLMARRINLTDASPKRIGQAFESMFLLVILPAILSELITGRGPEEDEDPGEWAMKTIAIYPAQSVILGRDLVSGVLGDYGYQMSPIVGTGATLAKGFNIAAEQLFGDDEEFTAYDAKTLFLWGGYMMHLPARQIWISGEESYNTIVEGEDFSLHEFLFRQKRD